MYKYIASISFGKDSLAMLLLLIRNRYTLDEVIFYDTGMEFQAIYDTRDIIKGLLHKLNIKYTELKPEIPFIDKMLNIEVHKRDGSIQFGYGLCGGRCRWGTTEKNKTIELADFLSYAETSPLKEDIYRILECIKTPEIVETSMEDYIFNIKECTWEEEIKKLKDAMYQTKRRRILKGSSPFVYFSNKLGVSFISFGKAISI